MLKKVYRIILKDYRMINKNNIKRFLKIKGLIFYRYFSSDKSNYLLLKKYSIKEFIAIKVVNYIK